MKTRAMGGILAGVLLFVLSGCNPFTTNIFSSIDPYQMPDLGDAGEILDAANDPDFYENLSEDETAKQEVLDTLQDVLDDPNADDETKQEVALVMADVFLKTADTDETLDNFNDLISEAANDSSAMEEKVSGGPDILFKSLFGDPPYGADTAITDPARVAYTELVSTQLEAFLLCIPSLEIYGNYYNQGIVPIDSNAGDTATKALMAGLTRYLCYMLDSDNDNSTASADGYVSGIEAGDIITLAAFLADPAEDATLDGQYNRELTVPDDVDEIEYFLTDPIDGDKGIYYAVNAGLDISALMD